MISNLKTSSAFLTCLVFVFSLLFVNINQLHSSNQTQTNNLPIKYFSIIQRHVSANVQPNVIMDYTEVEVCEESSDNEEDLTNNNSSITLSTFLSFFKRTTFISKSNHPFDVIKCDLYPRKHIVISILRI